MRKLCVKCIAMMKYHWHELAKGFSHHFPTEHYNNMMHGL